MTNLYEIDKIVYVRVEIGKRLSTNSKRKTKYYFLSGKGENNEIDEETLIRELREELNVSIILGTINNFGATQHLLGLLI